MDFTQRGPHQNPTTNPTVSAPGGPTSKKKRMGFAWMKLGAFALLLGCTILVIALLVSVLTSSPTTEDKYVNNKGLQAVFLNGGQVYFGNITTLNGKYVRLNNIYYLRVNQTVQPNQANANSAANSNDVSLVKLGCELHGPEDQMVINREQVIFWENLKSDGQVAKAVAAFVQQNPKGQNCAQANNSSSSSNSSTTPSSSSSTTPATAGGTNKQ
jgi:hypothetical protein